MNDTLIELLTHYETLGYDYVVLELSNNSSFELLLHDVAFLNASVTVLNGSIKATKVDSEQFSRNLMAAGENPASILDRMQKSLDIYSGIDAHTISEDPKLLSFFPKSKVTFLNNAFTVFRAVYRDHFFDPKYMYHAVTANGALVEYRILNSQYRSDVAIDVGKIVRCIPHHIEYDVKNPIVRAWAKRQSK